MKNLLCLSVLVISRAVLMMRYQFFGAVIEVYNMVERGVLKYEL